MNKYYNFYFQSVQFNQLISSLQELWCDFFVDQNKFFEKITEANYDLMCKLADEVGKPMSLNLTRNFAKSIEKKRL